MTGISLLYTTRSRLIISFLGVSLLVCSVALLVGSRLLYKAIRNEASSRASLDLNVAREIYLSRAKTISLALNLVAKEPYCLSTLEKRDVQGLAGLLNVVANQAQLDFLGIAAKDAGTVYHIGPNSMPGKNSPSNPIAELAFQKKNGIYGTVILSSEFLREENPELADRAGIQWPAAGISEAGAERNASSGMALVAAVPIFQSGNLLGVIYGGILLNQSQDIVDRVRDTVFQHEEYKGHSIGPASIFQNDIRISTNVLNPDGKRAIGTMAPPEAARSVLINGKKWTDRALVMKEWYVAAYEPIEDIFGRRVGMLSVGVLEAKYVDIRSDALSLFILITVAGMALAVCLGYFIASKINQPVKALIEASTQVTQGNLTPDIGPISKSEIGVLQQTFNEMLRSLRKRDEHQKAEGEKRLLQFEKQASIGKLAGGVAHEINNPLTGIVTFTHMLLKNKSISDDIRQDLETIAEETDRVRKIVKGLLDFSRQTELSREWTDINSLVHGTVSLVENHALIKGISLSFEKGEGLPLARLDRNQIQSVLLNIIINALEATESGGQITMRTGMGVSAHIPEQKGIEIICRDTGSGIPPENLDQIFDPFFTTKEIGRGTGLGLSVSFGIVERHGGTIRAQSEVGQGSTFTIWLPIEEQDTANANTGN